MYVWFLLTIFLDIGFMRYCTCVCLVSIDYILRHLIYEVLYLCMFGFY